jgi:hypothetical protein
MDPLFYLIVAMLIFGAAGALTWWSRGRDVPRVR